MEIRLATKIQEYLTLFKADLIEQIQGGMGSEELVSYLDQYQELRLTEDDFHKRKRSKNMVPLCERCIAKRIDGTQCSRRKQTEREYCGTHVKGQPYGNIPTTPIPVPSGTHRTKAVWCEPVNGIYYYIDDDGNVYNTDDIVRNIPNPKVIATYVKTGDEYQIPALFDK
jgi:hypothetical protein